MKLKKKVHRFVICLFSATSKLQRCGKKYEVLDFESRGTRYTHKGIRVLWKSHTQVNIYPDLCVSLKQNKNIRGQHGGKYNQKYEGVQDDLANVVATAVILGQCSCSIRQNNLQTICQRRYYWRFLISRTISSQFKTEKVSLWEPGPKIEILTCKK